MKRNLETIPEWTYFATIWGCFPGWGFLILVVPWWSGFHCFTASFNNRLRTEFLCKFSSGLRQSGSLLWWEPAVMVLTVVWMGHAQDGIYLLRVSRSTRLRCEICSKLTIKTPERCQWRRSGFVIGNFEHISNLL